MGILTPDEMAKTILTSREVAIIKALVNTAERTTDLEKVYNDSTGESFTWYEVYHFVKSLDG
jgi:hypothetical protein